ncbi:MAG TPA: 2-oxo-4-hydroxy-4-carboxy-5-ureidoimidazoline decarboxylase [Candidatus Acidoferrales bacterium]|jgi:OHCU decarboxylase|nr:2-oxo-4-hydroxy-4-carboxy-5-ureidoimidazoline decarboxylase [Candidatus Acidoferrales bacterium]
MRSDPAEYDLVAPANLQAAVSLLANEPDRWLPIAGGTDLMVQFAAGTLRARNLISISRLPELRRIEAFAEEIEIGAGCTYSDIRKHESVQREFPMLAKAASWTGGIANQNRGTLGGNIVNASPAADSLPALLVYGAELILVSVRGERRVLYSTFHTGYKKLTLAADELIRAVCLPRRFTGYVSYTRKVGTRNAQAVSKVCMAALARLEIGAIHDARIALGSVAPTPIRLTETERLLDRKPLDPSLVRLASRTAVAEVQPIDDIRSTARYRGAVVGNLVTEFLEKLGGTQRMRSVALDRWNGLPMDEAEKEILPCCGSRAWARSMAARRPFSDENSVLAASDETWRSLGEQDWMEAFAHHPRIGESLAAPSATARSAAWSSQEQSDAAAAGDAVKIALREGNGEYERRFGRTFIICATGKSGSEILQILRHRLQNDDRTEIREAAEQQRQISQIRLRKWLQG